MQSLSVVSHYLPVFVAAEDALIEVRISMRLVGNALEDMSKLHMNGSKCHIGSHMDAVPE